MTGHLEQLPVETHRRVFRINHQQLRLASTVCVVPDLDLIGTRLMGDSVVMNSTRLHTTNMPAHQYQTTAFKVTLPLMCTALLHSPME